MAKKRITNYVFQPGVSKSSNAYPNAHALLVANKSFIQKEARAWISQQITIDSANNLYPDAVRLLTLNKQFILDEISAWTTAQVATATVSSVFFGYVYGATEIAKCKRDVGYLVDALAYDIRYGGNERVSFVASQYYLSGTIQVINAQVETAIQTKLWNLIQGFVMQKILYSPTDQSPVTSTQNITGNAGEAAAVTRAFVLSPMISNVINGGLSTLPATIYSQYNFPGYTYDSDKCERDVGYVIDAYLHDLKYGGNVSTRLISSRYWDGENPQVDGDRKPEIATHTFIRDLINDYIFRGDYIAKCERDIGYLLDGVKYDITLGTNYNSIFLGLAEYNSLDIDDIVVSTIQAAASAVANLTEVSSSATALSRSNDFFSEVVDIATNGRSSANVLTYSNPTTATASRIAVKDKLVANRDFLAEEINAWVALNYPASTHDPAKCIRDVHYAIDALCYDMLYGGNSATYAQAKFFFYGFASGAAGINSTHTATTIAAYNYLKSIIDNVVQGQAIVPTTVGSNPNTLAQTTSGNNATLSDATACQNLVQITTNVISAASQSAALTYLAGVTKTYPDVTWAPTPLQDAEDAIILAKDSIIASVVGYQPLQITVPIQSLPAPGEAGATPRITSLAGIVVTVITNGLASLPAIANGVTSLKIQGYYPLDKILLITNSKTNQIIYNFSDPQLGATATFDAPHNSNGRDRDEDYPSYLQTTDTITVLELEADTSTGSSTDDIQIFVEAEEQKTRPYDFGTDAIERMRVAQPQSMLDADFEYGLQPTKWQAIGVARGYPSVYEIPGTDTAVVSVTTDASTGTGGVGNSLITVTTQGPHGFSAGTPITIRALANTISGFSRAEGTFIIISVPTPATFTYYATAKVGTSNGQVLATSYSQLRKGAFYTGASIGSPTISVNSNGLNSSFSSKFITPITSDQVAVAATLPLLNVPLSGTGINAGTQVTGTVGPGGLAVTANISDPVSIGDTSITVVDATGVLEGMAIDNGTGTAIFVSTVSTNTISFTQPLTANRGGASQSYTNKTGTNIIPGGTGALFDVDRVSGVYTNINISDPGLDYVDGSRLVILGTDLGGASPANDLTIKVSSTINLDTFNNVVQNGTSGIGTSAEFNITLLSGGAYEVTNISTSGSDYAVGDTITLLGTNLGGATPANDATVTVATVTQNYSGITQDSTTGLGSTATFNISRTGAVYTLTVSTKGIDYTPGDTVTIFGTQLGGATPANDLTFTVTDVDITNGINAFDTQIGIATGIGGIYGVSSITGICNFVGGLINTVSVVSGTSISGEREYAAIIQDATSASGSGAIFDIATSGGIYDVVIVDPGLTYAFGDTITILGTQLGGLSPANDLELTVTSASSFGGGILAFNTAGVPSSVDDNFLAVSVTNIAPGDGASFDISRAGGLYTSVTVNLPGLGYEVNDRIVLNGANFGGVNPTNNVTLTVTSVNVSDGSIVTSTASGTAVSGSALEFWSAVALSEPTTASIPDNTTLTTSAIATIQIRFTSPHGLVPGANILVDISSAGTNHALAKGPFYVESVPSPTTINFTARTVGVVDTGVALVGLVYARPDSYFIHRPYDGGVQLGTGGPQHGAQAIRMSKKYIRYQSGKGIMYTTGALFAPSYNLQSISADGTSVGAYITVTTDDVDHGCQVGGRIRIIGVDTAGYNGEYIISDVITERQFKVQAYTTLANVYGSITTAAQMSIVGWHGATVRAGTFDDQNGMFWEYDGTELAVGKRSSTLQLSGISSINRDSNTLTGSNTRFRDQVKAGDRIVIKGMTHVVSNVQSQTQLTVTPDYRGAVNAVQSKVCLVQDLIIKQSDFNLDRLDGTGPSGYNLDISKMQMIGMQWSWYGAGFIDYMLRGSDGNYVFAHRIRNSNINTEAYMRTGNMPVRYEVINESALGKLKSSITATQTTIPLIDASQFPNEAGTVYIDNELVQFGGKVNNTLINCVRSSPMVLFTGGAQRSFRAGLASVHEYNTGVILVSNTITPIISHWGSAMLTDGRFDEDRGYLFNYASTGIQVSTTKQTAFLIRLAPSVSNAIIGDLGERELINRAQLLLKSIAVTSDSGTGGLVVEGVLNPQNYPVDPAAISWSGLAGSSAGGQPSFAQVAPGGSVSWAGGATTTTSTATTTTALTGTASVPNNSLFESAIGSAVLYVTKASWDTLGAAVGFSVAASETKYPSGTTVSSVTANPSPIATTLGVITGTATIPPSVNFKTPAGSNQLFFTQASWNALGAVAGTAIFSPDFGPGTTVQSIAGPSFAAGQSYFTITTSTNSLVPHNPVTTSLATYYLQAFNSIQVTAYFNVGQSIAPYQIGDSITISGNPSRPQVNGTWSVTACTTSYVQFNIATTLNTNGGSNGTVVNNNALNTVSFFITGAAGLGVTALNFTQASWNLLPIGTRLVTNTVNDSAKFTAGTQISAISAVRTFAGTAYFTVTFNSGLLAAQPAGTGVTFNFTPYYIIGLSKSATSTIVANASVAFTPAVIATNTSFLYFTQTSWEALTSGYGATTGTEIVDPTKFPSGTKIASLSPLSSFGGVAYYRVNFTQSSVIAISAASTITFQFGLPPYAQPGETVFSFIAAPGGAQTLDLGELKELTNTTLGGRGTYPNGPDVLAINVYRASGAGSIPTNIVVRWGEAQA